MPSGGDWGLFRGGAIFIEGAEGITVANNTLTRLDGNGVFVSGYTRAVNITDNEFSWIGCNPMASWGYTDENDGTDGQQPRYTYIARNYVSSADICNLYVGHHYEWPIHDGGI